MSLEWNGAEAIAKATRALQIGIDKTTSDATIEAKRLVNRDTTTLQGSIYPEPAKLTAEGQMEGAYGPHDVEYAVVQEFLQGETMPDGTTRDRKGGKPYMRPSQTNAAEKLPGNIVDAYRGLT
jgi:hypothetical protein